MPKSEAMPPHRAPSHGSDARANHSPAEIARMEAAMKQCETDMAAQRRRQWEALGARDDVESRLTHALMASTVGEASNQPSTAQLLEAAAVAVPDDADVAWYRAAHCPKDAGCDRDRAIARVLELEPGNLDGWLMALGEAARSQHDDATLQALLERAAEASYYDARDGETFARLYQATRDLPLPGSCKTPLVVRGWRQLFGNAPSGPGAADMAAIWAMAMQAAEIKAYSPIGKLCRPKDAPLSRERIAACRSVLAMLASNASLIDQAVGMSAMVELSAGTPEASAWRERYRNLQWLQAAHASNRHFDVESLVRRMIEGEVPAMQAELEAHGRWPAPAGWLPDNERARSLIQTGRPPPDPRR